jgi:hypothetical protein
VIIGQKGEHLVQPIAEQRRHASTVHSVSIDRLRRVLSAGERRRVDAVHEHESVWREGHGRGGIT